MPSESRRENLKAHSFQLKSRHGLDLAAYFISSFTLVNGPIISMGSICRCEACVLQKSDSYFHYRKRWTELLDYFWGFQKQIYSPSASTLIMKSKLQLSVKQWFCLVKQDQVNKFCYLETSLAFQ